MDMFQKQLVTSNHHLFLWLCAFSVILPGIVTGSSSLSLRQMYSLTCSFTLLSHSLLFLHLYLLLASVMVSRGVDWSLHPRQPLSPDTYISKQSRESLHTWHTHTQTHQWSPSQDNLEWHGLLIFCGWISRPFPRHHNLLINWTGLLN